MPGDVALAIPTLDLRDASRQRTVTLARPGDTPPSHARGPVKVVDRNPNHGAAEPRNDWSEVVRERGLARSIHTIDGNAHRMPRCAADEPLGQLLQQRLAGHRLGFQRWSHLGSAHSSTRSFTEYTTG
jgi:hypothetical protein